MTDAEYITHVLAMCSELSRAEWCAMPADADELYGEWVVMRPNGVLLPEKMNRRQALEAIVRETT